MVEPILATRGLRKRFGALVATEDLYLDVVPGEIHAIIGPNGAGKTTLIAQLSGELRPDAGQILFDGEDISGLPVHRRSHLGLARSFQITSLFLNFTVIENAALAVQAHDGHSFRFWRPAARDPGLREPAMNALQRFGLSDRADIVTANLSHGEQRQLELAMAWATQPRALLLDEPMAGMGPDESIRMVEVLRSLKADHTIVLIEHDMDAVFALADQITVLVYGQAIATGTPADIRASAEVRQAYLGDEAD